MFSLILGLVRETQRRGHCNFASTGYEDKVSDFEIEEYSGG